MKKTDKDIAQKAPPKPFFDLKDVWTWFGYGSYPLTLRAINRGIFPMHTYRVGNTVAIDKVAFDAFFLIRRDDALEELTKRVIQNQLRMEKLYKLGSDKTWYGERIKPENVLKEFPRELEPLPQEWDPQVEFPDDLVEPKIEVPKMEDVMLDGYYKK